MGLTDGLLQLYQPSRPKVYTLELDLKICVSQPQDPRENETRDILDLRIETSRIGQEWQEWEGSDQWNARIETAG